MARKFPQNQQKEQPKGICDTCPLHRTMEYRLSMIEESEGARESCQQDIKKDVAKLVTGQAVMQQKFDNLRIPIWIIFGALLLQVAKWIGSSPIANSVAENVILK